MGLFSKVDRMEDFSSCANTLGWELQPKDDFGMLKWLLDFNLFKLGGGKKISPIIRKRETELEHSCLFDYAYTVSTGKSAHTFKQTVYFRYSKSIALPHFVMVPEKWYHRVGTYFGMQDIDFVEYPIFSRNYLLKGEDEDYIRHHFDNPDLMRYFDQQGFYSLEGMNYLLILYVHNVLLPVEQSLQLVKIGDHLHDYFADKTPGIELPKMDYSKIPDLD